MLLFVLFPCAALAAPPTWSPPPAHTIAPDLDEGAELLLADFKRTVEAQMAAGDWGSIAAHFGAYGDRVREWGEDVRGHAVQPMQVLLEPRWGGASSVVLHLTLFSPKDDRGGVSRYRFEDVSLRRVGADRWRVSPSQEQNIDRTSATVHLWLDPAAEWLQAEVRYAARTQGAQRAVFTLPIRRAGELGGMRVSEVRVDGEAAPFSTLDGYLVVPLPERDEVELVIRYAGQLAPSDGAYVRADEVLLRGRDTHWMPDIQDDRMDLEVAITSPNGFVVWGQGTPTSMGAEDGWHTERWLLPASTDFTLYGAPTYVTSTQAVGSAEVTVALWPMHEARLEGMALAANRSLLALVDGLGDYPFPDLRLVESGFHDGRGGYGAVTNIAVGWRSVEGEPDRGFVAHEMAHGWFGGQVILASEAASRGQWNESLAEYVSAWAFSEEEALEKRREWSERYAALPDSEDRPMLEVGTASAPWARHHAVTYSKGALLLCALEDRLGMDGMRAWMRGFLKELKGQPATWSSISATLPAEDGAWLWSWLAASGAPDLALSATWRGNTAKVRLTQSSSLEGVVEVGLLDADGTLLGLERLGFQGPSSSHTLEVPVGTASLVLDPRYRLPRRYDPRADPVQQGLVATR